MYPCDHRPEADADSLIKAIIGQEGTTGGMGRWQAARFPGG